MKKQRASYWTMIKWIYRQCNDKTQLFKSVLWAEDVILQFPLGKKIAIYLTCIYYIWYGHKMSGTFPNYTDKEYLSFTDKEIEKHT
jgi:hypothetical protein